jgi:hypothetical protein
MVPLADIAPLRSDGVVTLRSHRDSDADAIVDRCRNRSRCA